MKKILVIEDNEANSYLVRYILEKFGYEVIVAPNAREGIDLALTVKPDLVIMDIQLPDIDGLEATRQIRKRETGPPIPILALTSYAMVGDREKALAAGCSGYLEKPIDPETFVDDIQKSLKPDTPCGIQEEI